MEELVSYLQRAALWALVIVVLASSLASIVGATSAASPSYRLIGYVEQPGGASAPPVPAGVQVDLVSRSTGAIYTTAVTGSGGQFSFTTSGTGNTLAPGYWGLWVPSEANVSLTHCSQCAVLPLDQNPTYAFYNTTQLTNSTYSAIISNVQILPYNSTLNGTVFSGGSPDAGAQLSLLDPEYNDLVLANATSNATGVYGLLHVPFGTYVLQTVQASGSSTYTNTSSITISSRTTQIFNPVLESYFLSGRIYTGTGFVPTAGNATLFDPTDGYIYTVPTAPGGYYGFPTYPAGFHSGTQTFDVILSAVGYQTTWFTENVSSAAPLSHNVLVVPTPAKQLGVFATTLNFTGINVTNGTGNLSVQTTVSLGNDSVLPNLPNGTVGQLWAQLGLDFNHSLVLPRADLAGVQSWVNSTGPFFPATQALTTINGTAFVPPTAAQAEPTFSSTCTTFCGLGSNAGITYNWSDVYALNGTIPENASSYTIAFAFQHPLSSGDRFNYTLELPEGYVLSANTAAPAHTQLVGAGANGTWSKFTLVSNPSSTVPASAKFTIVKLGVPTPIVNATVQNFAFSKLNVLNSTEGNYTVVVGAGENVTFSAINSTYPTGTNATSFKWVFGDGGMTVTNNTTTNHTYLLANGTNPWNGSLTITASGGTVNTTNFYVYVVATHVNPTAVILSNATTAQNKTTRAVGGTPYIEVNWSTTLAFNATNSTVPDVAPGPPVIPGNISVASYKLTAKNFNQTANFTTSKGGTYSANWSVQFNGAGLYLSSTVINGTTIPFKGWEYNLTLTVWSSTGENATTSIVILVNDTQKPVPSFQMLTAAGKPVSTTGLIEQANGTAEVRLNASGSNDSSNGSIANYNFRITNPSTSFTNFSKNYTTAKPFPAFWLKPQTQPYTINLTVTDAAGNKANSTQTLSVSYNTSILPILAATNLTGPTSLTDGTTYTFWVNVTIGGGLKAVAKDVTVSFYILSATGSGSKTYFSGSPGSVQFYNYTSKGVANTTVLATGSVPTVAFNKTLRAVITWNPGVTGNFILYANASASNEANSSYGTANIASLAISVKANPTTQLLEYGGIAAAVIIVIVALVWWYRRGKSPRRTAATKTSTGKGGLERGPKKAEPADEDEP